MKLNEKAIIKHIDYEGDDVPHVVKTSDFELRRTHYDQIDVRNLHCMFKDLQDPEDVFQYCGWSHHTDIAETEDFLYKRTDEWMDGDRYSYVIVKNGEYAGTTYIDLHTDKKSVTFGLWLRKRFWGNNLHGLITDARIHISFEKLDLLCVDVGCLDYNKKSLRSITDYISRYGGSYYGSPLVSYSRYGGDEELVPHHEFLITNEQYMSSETGIDTTISKVKWSDTHLSEISGN